jgi:histidinol dehydrogenase
MKKYYLKNLDKDALQDLCVRPAIDFDSVFGIVRPILKDIKENGDKAVSKYTKQFDGVNLDDFAVSTKEVDEACERLPQSLKNSFEAAAKNIEKFHKAQLTDKVSVETMSGVKCFQESRAIEKVGIYVPAGTAPLPSTVLMLGIPAKVAKCREIVMCTPPNKEGKVADEMLFAARLAGITKIFKVGGSQAIGAMAFGTETIPKVNKIFGPGNQYVTAAKMLVSTSPVGVAIDMPAGPSEVLVIADKDARADFVAADLLSQAEHGQDSQVVLVCTDENKTDEILEEVNKQLAELSRKDIAVKALESSYVLIVGNVADAIDFSNKYAPEHLILNVSKVNSYLDSIINAGSVFIGPYSCESAGDYASGTNHTLPTYGFARSYSGVNTDSFMKKITFQEITKEGVSALGSIVEEMAECEGLDAHKNAMTVRINSLTD